MSEDRSTTPWDAWRNAEARVRELEALSERLAVGQSCMLDDLAALLRALGLGDHARPETPHVVMLSTITEVERLRAALGDLVRRAEKVDSLRSSDKGGDWLEAYDRLRDAIHAASAALAPAQPEADASREASNVREVLP